MGLIEYHKEYNMKLIKYHKEYNMRLIEYHKEANMRLIKYHTKWMKRHWLNPMRLFKGEWYLVHISSGMILQSTALRRVK